MYGDFETLQLKLINLWLALRLELEMQEGNRNKTSANTRLD